VKVRRVAVVVGTRPEAIKLAPVVLALRRAPRRFQVRLISTGQHRELLRQHLRPFGLTPDVDLDVMQPRQSLSHITAASLTGLEAALADDPPELLLAEGDTTTVFAAGLAAFYQNVAVGHVEAGLRSRDKRHPFPEEINRRLMGALADLHFAPTPAARDNLLAEGVPADRIFVTGNTVLDALRTVADQPEPRRLPIPRSELRGRRLLLVTAHRRESWGRPLRDICLALSDLLRRFPDTVVVYAVHPNPVVRRTAADVLGKASRAFLIEPPDYDVFVHLMKRAYLALTDSGGVQEEAPSLHLPVLVLRETSERGEGIAAGAARLVGRRRADIVAAASHLLRHPGAREAMAHIPNPYGDGRAAGRIRQALEFHFGFRRRRPADFVPPAPRPGGG